MRGRVGNRGEAVGEKCLACRALLAFSKRRLLVCMGVAILVAALSTLSMYSRISLYGIGPERPSAGDAVLWLFMGNAVGFAPEWGAVWCLVLAAGIEDARVLASGGPACRYVVATGDRAIFWRSLCMVVALTSVLVVAVLMGAMTVFAVVLGGRLSLLPACIDAISLGDVMSGATTLDVAGFMALLLAGSAAFSLLGTALSLRVGRPASLGVCIAVLLGSAFLPMAPLPGSCLMTTRIDCFAGSTTVTTAWPFAIGLCELGLIGLLSFVLGGRAFDRAEFCVAEPRSSRVRSRACRGRHVLAPLRYCALVGLQPLCAAVLLGALVTAAQCVDLLGRVALYAPAGSCPGFADFLAYAFLGSRQPDPLGAAATATRFITVPFGWLVPVLIPQAWTFLFAVFMRCREAPEVLCGSRSAMWPCRCLATAGGVGLICLVQIAVCLLAVVVAGDAVNGSVSAWFADVAGLSRETLPAQVEGLSAFVVAYVVMCVGLALAQLAIAEFAGALPGLVALAAYLAGAVFLMSPVLLGNYLMAARSTVFVVPWQVEVQEGLLQAGLSPATGVVMGVILGAVSCLLGLWRAKTMEFYGGAGR